MNYEKLYKISQEIFMEHFERGIGEETTCDITLIPDYGYATDSEEANWIEGTVNALIINTAI